MESKLGPTYFALSPYLLSLIQEKYNLNKIGNIGIA